MQLYPSIPSEGTTDQSFRLARISELDAFLVKEVEDRRKMQKRYQRAAKAAQGLCAGVAVIGLSMEVIGLSLMATGTGALPGLVLAGLGAASFVVNLVCIPIGRKCAAKLAKYAAIEMAARTKLNSAHQMVSKALVDDKISGKEFKLITDEVDRYRVMKDEIRSKSRSASDETTKNEWIERGR